MNLNNLTEDEIDAILTGLAFRFNQDVLVNGESPSLRDAADSAGFKFVQALGRPAKLWTDYRDFPRRITVKTKKEVWR